MNLHRWCLFLSMLWQTLALAASPNLEVSLLAASDPAMSFAELALAPTQNASTAETLPPGPRSFAWYRVRLLQAHREPLLVLRNSFGAHLQVRMPDGSTLSQRRGEWPIAQPQYSQLNMVFELAAVQVGESVYLGVTAAPPQPILVGLYERSDYQALDADSVRLLNSCLGVLLAFATLGFVFYAVDRDRTSLAFACSLLLQFAYFGFMYGEAAFWPVLGRLWPNWIDVCVISATLGTIFFGEVYARLIDLPQRMPRLMIAIRLLHIWSLAISVITLVDWITRSESRGQWAVMAGSSGNYLVVIMTALLVYALVVSSLKGHRRALIALLATLVLASGNAMRATQFAFGWVGLEWAWSLHVLGMAIASSLVSLALTQRFLSLRSERDLAHQLATHDPLTGALNRLGGMTIAHRLFAQARQSGSPFCAAVLDLDHFKQVNDRFGHAVGDAALKLFADVTRASLRDGQQLMRLGGEEFVLLLPGMDRRRALDHVDAVRLSVQRHGEEIAGAPCRLTVSAGVAQLNEVHASIDAVLNEADQALYAAKRNGRNCAVAFVDLSTPAGANIDVQPGRA